MFNDDISPQSKMRGMKIHRILSYLKNQNLKD